jgi:hypothetical protein
MELQKAIEILEEWIKIDRAIREVSTDSDFDKFCEEKNVAIETVLKEVKSNK